VAAAHPGPNLNPADRMKIIGPNPAPGPTATGQPAAPTNRAVRTGLVTLVVLVLILAVVLGSTADGGGDGREIDFTDLSRAAANGQITKATVLEHDARITGARCFPRAQNRTPTPAPPPAPAPAPGGPPACNGDLADFQATYPRNDAVTQQLIGNITRNGSPLTIDHQTNKTLTRLFLTILLPLAILANMAALLTLVRRTDRQVTEVAGPSPSGTHTAD
jgi:hypothetical protein